MRVVMRGLLALVAVVLMAAGFLVHTNNRAVSTPSRAELDASLARAIHWMDSRRDKVLADTNTILWWMIDRSATLTGDATLRELSATFRQAYTTTHPDSVWARLFNPYSMAVIPDPLPENWDDYHVYFAYGLTCDNGLAQLDRLRQQQRPDFCLRHHPFSPACITHQLMGARFAQEQRCDDPQQLAALIAGLQDDLVTQLTFDPRVVDVYLQRVTLLVESGAATRVKPVWLRRILDAQLQDGGWQDGQPLVPVGTSRALGFTVRGLGITRQTGDFHTTAQGILLLSLLTHDPASLEHLAH